MLAASGAEVREARPWSPGARGSDQGETRGAECGAWSATSCESGVWAAWRLARMFCTVLMAEVVGEVEASLSWGLEECRSLEQLGLLGMSDSQ